MRFTAILLAPIALTAGMAGAAPRSPDVAVARIGQTVRLQGTRVTPVRVVEDSRGPQNARCVWAGRVRLAVQIGGAVREVTFGRPVRLAGGTLNLYGVMPERVTRARIQPGAYRFAFQFVPGDGITLTRDEAEQRQPAERQP